jgi:hypothetical protein
MPMTTYLKQKLLDHSVSKASFTMPTTTYAALLKADPTASGAWTDEMTAGDATNGYGRQDMTTAQKFGSASGSSITNSAGAITFGPASGNWSGACTYMALADSGTRAAGNMTYYDDITSTQVNNLESLTFATSSITITIT